MTFVENSFEDFFYLFLLLEDSLVLTYAEYDNEDRCYSNAHDCIPLKLTVNNKTLFRLRELKTGRIVQTFEDAPRDFKYGTFHFHGLHAKIVLHFKSGYYTSLYLKKKTPLS